MYRRLLFVVFCHVSTMATAETISDGFYAITTDGGAGTLEIEGDRGEISVPGQGCSGGMSGSLSRVEQGMVFLEGRDGAQICNISIEVDASGMPGQIMEGNGCGYFHGMSCSFNGEVAGLDVPWDIEALDQGFNDLLREERRAVQAILRDRGHYSGGIDGTTGPGTRLAIRDAAREDLATRPGLDLRRPDAVEAYLLSLVAPLESAGGSEDASNEDTPAVSKPLVSPEEGAASLAVPASADPVAEGAAFVKANCARCHGVTAEDHSANPRAIPFRFLGRLYPIESLEEALAEGIVVSHEMPEFVLEQDEVLALIAYLDSIQVRW